MDFIIEVPFPATGKPPPLFIKAWPSETEIREKDSSVIRCFFFDHRLGILPTEEGRKGIVIKSEQVEGVFVLPSKEEQVEQFQQ